MNTGTEHPHLYRFGFLVPAAAVLISSRPNGRWRRERHEDLALLVHEETEVQRVTEASGSALLLGRAFPIGEPSVEAVLRRLIAAPENEVAAELSRLGGRFCVIVRNGSGLRAYTDAIGSRTLYYSVTQPGCLASHAELLATHLGAARSERAMAFIKTAKYQALSVKYLPGDLTMYEGIHSLVPNHAFHFGNPRTERIWPLRPRQTRSIEEFFERCDVYFAALAQGLGSKTAFIGLTGGIDTRFLLAGLARNGVKPRAMTWLGAYHDPREQPVIEEIAARMGIDNQFIEPRGALDAIADLAGRNGGGSRGPSRLTSAISAGLPNHENAIFARGYGGEIMRGFYNLLKYPMCDGSSGEMIRIYAAKSTVKEPDPVFDEFSREAFEGFVARAGYDETLFALGYDVNDLFYWEQRMGTWGAAMHNEMDPAMQGMTGLNDREMFDLALGLPSQQRLKKKLFRQYIERVEPRLGDLPIV